MQPQQYPPQQPYAQPAYAPQPQQGYPPQGQPYPQPQYAPQPPQEYPPAQPQYAPPAQHAPTGPAVPQTFDNPRPPQSSVTRPRMTDFGHDGRLVIISPTKIDRGVPNNLGAPGSTQDRMTADVQILDGHPFPFGGAPEKGKPHTLQATIPYEIPAMFISNVGLISQCETRIGGHVLGRLHSVSLPNGNTAYRIDDPTDHDRELARQWAAAKVAGQLAAPQAQPAPVAAPPQAPPQPQYAPQPAPAYPQSAPPAQPYGDPYAAQQYPPQQGYPAQAPPQYAPQPQAQPAQWAPPAQQLDVNVAPNGYPGGQPAWDALPPDQRAMIAGAAASQQRPGV